MSRLAEGILGPIAVLGAIALAAITPRAAHEATVQRATLSQVRQDDRYLWRVWECRNKPRDCYHGGRLRFIIYTGGDWR